VIVGIHSENSSADRRKFRRRFFSVCPRLFLGESEDRDLCSSGPKHGGASRSSYFSDRSSAFALWKMNAQSLSCGRRQRKWRTAENRYEETGVHTSHFAILSAPISRDSQFPPLEFPCYEAALADINYTTAHTHMQLPLPLCNWDSWWVACTNKTQTSWTALGSFHTDASDQVARHNTLTSFLTFITDS